MKENFEYFLFRGIVFIVQSLPLRGVRAAASFIARFVYHVLRIRRSLTLLQLRRAFPEKSAKEISKIAYGSYRNMVTTILELLWTPRLTEPLLKENLNLTNPDVVQNAVRKGRGLVFMTGHFGNWEWLCTGSAKLLGLTFSGIVHPMRNRKVDGMVESFRAGAGLKILPMSRSVREVITTLRSRGVVTLLADQSGPEGSYYVRFFGKPAATYQGPAMFALKTGAAIVMAFAVRSSDGSYNVVFEEIPTEDLTEASEQNLKILTFRHVKALEGMVRQHPDHWLWQHKRWKHSPPHADMVIPEDIDQ